MAGRSLHVSPSQIATYRSCKRKWAWDKIAGIKRKGNASAALGSEVHELLENWLMHGKLPPADTRAGAIAASALTDLPAPSIDAANVEREFAFEIDGVKYIGKIDLCDDERIYPLVHDHKTTSNFKWAKTPAVLATDEQAVIYGFEVLRHNDAPGADLCWLYIETGKRRRTRPVTLTLTREHIEAEMAKLHPIAVEMVEHRKAETPPLSLPFTVETCAAYGGCAYQEHCNLSSADRMKALITQHSLKEKVEMGLSLADKMKARKEAAEAGDVTAETPPPSSPKDGTPPKTKGINPPKTKPKSDDNGTVAAEAVARKLAGREDQIVVLLMSPEQLRDLLNK